MQTILLGTYTRKNSEGIYQITLDTKQEKLVDLKLIANTQNPTYLDYHEGTLYSVYQKDNEGGVAIYNYQNEETKLIEAITEEGVQPCYVHFNPVRNEIYDSNYHRGIVNVYQDGKIKETISYPKGAHAHYAHTHPKTNALYTVDLGNDMIHKYENLEEVATYKAKTGSGPRHLVFHPNAPYIYAFTEHSCEVIVLKDDKELKEIQVIDALDKEDEKSGAAIRITKDGKFLYVSNRGHDSITAFKINDDYTVTKIQNISTEGEHPRDFNLDKEENFIVVANRDTNNLTLFKRDKTTGLLTLISSNTEVFEPVAVLFI